MTSEPESRAWWNTVDFRPALPGWRVVSIWPPGQVEVRPVAGWLIQERYLLGSDSEPIDRLAPGEEVLGRRRRVVPGVIAEGYGWAVEPLDENLEGGDDNTWLVLGPGEPDPTEDETKKELQRRAARSENGSAAVEPSSS